MASNIPPWNWLQLASFYSCLGMFHESIITSDHLIKLIVSASGGRQGNNIKGWELSSSGNVLFYFSDVTKNLS